MKNYIFFLLIITIASLILSSCEDVIDVKLDQGETLLAVDGRVTDDTTVNYQVKLSQTIPYFDNKVSPSVSGAFVEIKDFDEMGTLITTDTLQEQIQGSGIYISSKLKGKTNHKYILTVRAMGEEYKAETYIKRIPETDSLTYIYKEQTNFNDAGYYIKYYGPEPVGKGDYYRFKTYNNGWFENDPSRLAFTSDEFVDGNYITGPELNILPYSLYDTVKLEFLSLTKDEYYFLNELYYQVNNGGPFANPPANVRTNIFNINPNRKKAVGYFGGNGIRTTTIVIK